VRQPLPLDTTTTPTSGTAPCTAWLTGDDANHRRKPRRRRRRYSIHAPLHRRPQRPQRLPQRVTQRPQPSTASTPPTTAIGTRERHGSSNSGLRPPNRHRCAPSLSFFFLHETGHFFPRATTRRSQSSSRLRGFARRRLRSTTPAVVDVTPAPTHPNPCLSSSAREKGVVTPSTRHHRADHTATRFESVTRSRSTVDELRIAGGRRRRGFLSSYFFFDLCWVISVNLRRECLVYCARLVDLWWEVGVAAWRRWSRVCQCVLSMWVLFSLAFVQV